MSNFGDAGLHAADVWDVATALTLALALAVSHRNTSFEKLSWNEIIYHTNIHHHKYHHYLHYT